MMLLGAADADAADAAAAASKCQERGNKKRAVRQEEIQRGTKGSINPIFVLSLSLSLFLSFSLSLSLFLLLSHLLFSSFFTHTNINNNCPHKVKRTHLYIHTPLYSIE